jgi:hypothetical protein
VNGIRSTSAGKPKVFLLDTILRAVRGKIPDPNPTSGKLLLNIWKKIDAKVYKKKNEQKRTRI